MFDVSGLYPLQLVIGSYVKTLVRRVLSDRYRMTQDKFQYHGVEIYDVLGLYPLSRTYDFDNLPSLYWQFRLFLGILTPDTIKIIIQKCFTVVAATSHPFPSFTLTNTCQSYDKSGMRSL